MCQPFLKMKCNWETLSTFRNLSVLKIGYIGTISVSIYATLVYQFNDSIGIPLPFSIWASLLFIGSFALSVAHIMNEALCPQTIKSYGTLDEYRKRQAKFVVHQKEIKKSASPNIKRRMVEKSEGHEFAPNLSEENLDKLFDHAVSTIVDMETHQMIEEAGVEAYNTTWEEENTQKPKIARLIFCLYIFSLIISAILALRQVYIVLTVTIHQLLI
jgi:hypothetical protein